MFNLNCVDRFRYPGQDEVYVLDVVPLVQGPATISSDQKLCFFNPLSLQAGPVKTLGTSHGNLTCVKAFDLGGSVVATAGEDGSISMWDLRQDERQAEVARMSGRFPKYVSFYECLFTDLFFFFFSRQQGAYFITRMFKCNLLCRRRYRVAIQPSIHLDMVSSPWELLAAYQVLLTP
jgi:hypothetical protein